VERAREKLRRKGADMIVVNDISRADIGFESELNEVVLVTSNDETLVTRRSKRACAAAILDWVANQPAGAAVEQRTTV
jgi:phosphopantothenoylcysteine decarboxylase / phosphopantothenate---cysteine ligase